MRSLTRIALLLLCALSLSAQSDVWKYSRSATLAGTSVAFTVALPATGNNLVQMLDMIVQCTVDCTVSTERNGTAPTVTLASWRPEDYATAPKDGSGVTIQPGVNIYYDSNSTGGSTDDMAFTFPAGALIPWGFGDQSLMGAGATRNYTIRIGPMTGTYRFQLRVRVRR